MAFDGARSGVHGECAFRVGSYVHGIVASLIAHIDDGHGAGAWQCRVGGSKVKTLLEHQQIRSVFGEIDADIFEHSRVANAVVCSAVRCPHYYTNSLVGGIYAVKISINMQNQVVIGRDLAIRVHLSYDESTCVVSHHRGNHGGVFECRTGRNCDGFSRGIVGSGHGICLVGTGVKIEEILECDLVPVYRYANIEGGHLATIGLERITGVVALGSGEIAYRVNDSFALPYGTLRANRSYRLFTTMRLSHLKQLRLRQTVCCIKRVGIPRHGSLLFKQCL